MRVRIREYRVTHSTRTLWVDVPGTLILGSHRGEEEPRIAQLAAEAKPKPRWHVDSDTIQRVAHEFFSDDARLADPHFLEGG